MWPFGKSTAERVKDALNENPILGALNLQVQEQGGVVSISGRVPRSSLTGLINITAEGISGVKSVDLSGITVDQPAAAPAQPAPATPDATVTEIAPTTGNMNAGAGTDDEIQEMEDRSRVAKAVLHAIRSNGELADDPIDVLQSGNSVILRGVVDSEHEQRLLEQVARGVDGVSGVDLSGVRVAEGAKELAKEKDQDSGDTVYVVKAGDSLSAIAERYYGDASHYKKIAHYNNISNPDLIHPGDRLRIPG